MLCGIAFSWCSRCCTRPRNRSERISRLCDAVTESVNGGDFFRYNGKGRNEESYSGLLAHKLSVELGGEVDVMHQPLLSNGRPDILILRDSKCGCVIEVGMDGNN